MSEPNRSTTEYIREVAQRSQLLLEGLKGENEQQQRLIRELGERLEGALERIDSDEQIRRERDELRLVTAAQREELGQLHHELTTLRAQVETQRSERQELRRLIEDMDARRGGMANQYAEVERQYSNLLSLYVASCQLQQTVDEAEVFTIVEEVVINLIGCEELAIYCMDVPEATLRVVRSYGLAKDKLQDVPVGTGRVGQVAASGRPFVSGESLGERELGWEQGMTACIPLAFKEQVLGALVTYGMLAQKAETISDVDRELFDLLGGHAGAAMYYSRLAAGNPLAD